MARRPPSPSFHSHPPSNRAGTTLIVVLIEQLFHFEWRYGIPALLACATPPFRLYVFLLPEGTRLGSSVDRSNIATRPRIPVSKSLSRCLRLRRQLLAAKGLCSSSCILPLLPQVPSPTGREFSLDSFFFKLGHGFIEIS